MGRRRRIQCIAYDALTGEHLKVLDELHRKTPFPTFLPEAGMERHCARMEQVFKLRWSIDPYCSAVAIRDPEIIRDRFAVGSEVAAMLREHFINEVAPSMWDRAQHEVLRQIR